MASSLSPLHDEESPLLERSDVRRKSKKESVIPEGLLPAYLASAFAELYEEDGLMVFGKGLGFLSLMASFVRFYADVEEGHVAVLEDTKQQKRSTEPVKPPLVLVLGLKDSEHQALISLLETWGTPPELLPTVITNENGQGKDRACLYAKGGVFCITSRILIVDLLTNIASPKDIDGMLIAHADQVTNESTEAFIIRIYTSLKRRDKGFIKAFTDRPDQLLSGFAKIDKTLKALQVRHLYLFPRFHDSVRQELERYPPDVEELHQELSPKMKEIQTAIAAAVQTCMRELKQSTPFLEWTGADLSIENCVTSGFDRAVSRQLEKDWHRLRPQTKQLVQDLRTLRTLFQSLIQYDCVSFWKLINSIKTMSAASRHPSMWLLTPAADVLFRKAKERIYTIHRRNPTAKIPNPVGKLIPVLEENPKWRLLKKVLGEIQQEGEDKPGNPDRRPATILVMVKDERTVDAVRAYLVDGKDRTMTLRWLNYLEHYNDRSRSIADCKISEESRLLLEEEGRARRLLFGKNREGNKKAASEVDLQEKELATGKRKKQLNEVPNYIKKHRRIAVEKGRGGFTGQQEDLERQAVLDEALEKTEHDLDGGNFRSGAQATRTGNGSADEDEASEDIYDTMFTVTVPQEPRVIIKSFSSIEGDQSGLLLQDLQPNFVVVYDTDVAFIRALEIYSALSSRDDEDRLKVYFLVFEASAEQKNFMKSLEREQNAFERLIHHKKTMPPPVLRVEGTQEMQQALATGSVAGTYQNGTLPLAVDTRTGKGKAKPDSEKRDIAVDVREFRSALPSILHQGGMRLAPVTLTVGDFVLSSVHCVERKSISDLFGSFTSGRLYTQAEAMSKYYKCPSLLIEFDPSKSFCLQNSNELGVEIRTDSVCSKMAILSMAFPKLRILWSRSPHETLRLFKELKANHDEVDVDKAVEIGRSESVEALLKRDDDEDEVNEVARDMLLRLPGVNIHSARRIMSQVDSLAELSEMSREQLRKIAGPVAGQKLFTLFRQKMAAT
jgi:DNA excision repair protein ERCC-4